MEALRDAGIADPVEHYQQIVKNMNEERKRGLAAKKARPPQIGDRPPVTHLGHFPLRAINEALGVKEDIDALQVPAGFDFSAADLLSSLAYGCAVACCRGWRDLPDWLPVGAGEADRYSADQVREGLTFLGERYDKVIECYKAHGEDLFGNVVGDTFLYRADFSFGAEVVASMGLMVNGSAIPVALHLAFGEAGIRLKAEDLSGMLKRRYSLPGRTIVVVDESVSPMGGTADFVGTADGYVVAKLWEALSEDERSWVLAEDGGWREVLGQDGQLSYRYKETVCDGEDLAGGDADKRLADVPKKKRITLFDPEMARREMALIDEEVAKDWRMSGGRFEVEEAAATMRFLRFTEMAASSGEATVIAGVDYDAIREARAQAGYRMLVTSEVTMSGESVCDVFRRLQRMGESLRMGSDVICREVPVPRQGLIAGRLLVGYLSLLLTRLLEVKVLQGEFSSEEAADLIGGFAFVKQQGRGYVNLARSSRIIDCLADRTHLPLSNLYLKQNEFDAIGRCKLSQLMRNAEGSVPTGS